MIRRLPLILLLLTSPALADIPTIDGTVLDPREKLDRKTTDIDKVDRDPLCSFVSARLNSIAKAEVRDVVFADQASTQNLCTANLGVVDERSAL